MKHFFLINLLLLSALALLLLITSGEPITEHFGEKCRHNGACTGSEKCYQGFCTPNYTNTTNFTCRVNSDCTASQWCWNGSCNTKPANAPAPPFPAGENDPTWLLTRPNNRNFCPGASTASNNFCQSNRPYCIYKGAEGYYCSYTPS